MLECQRSRDLGVVTFFCSAEGASSFGVLAASALGEAGDGWCTPARSAMKRAPPVLSCARSRPSRWPVDRDSGPFLVGDHRLPLAERGQLGRASYRVIVNVAFAGEPMAASRYRPGASRRCP